MWRELLKNVSWRDPSAKGFGGPIPISYYFPLGESLLIILVWGGWVLVQFFQHSTRWICPLSLQDLPRYQPPQTQCIQVRLFASVAFHLLGQLPAPCSQRRQNQPPLILVITSSSFVYGSSITQKNSGSYSPNFFSHMNMPQHSTTRPRVGDLRDTFYLPLTRVSLLVGLVPMLAYPAPFVQLRRVMLRGIFVKLVLF